MANNKQLNGVMLEIIKENYGIRLLKSTRADGSIYYIINKPSKRNHIYMVRHNYKDAYKDYNKIINKIKRKMEK